MGVLKSSLQMPCLYFPVFICKGCSRYSWNKGRWEGPVRFCASVTPAWRIIVSIITYWQHHKLVIYNECVCVWWRMRKLLHTTRQFERMPVGKPGENTFVIMAKEYWAPKQRTSLLILWYIYIYFFFFFKFMHIVQPYKKYRKYICLMKQEVRSHPWPHHVGATTVSRCLVTLLFFWL